MKQSKKKSILCSIKRNRKLKEDIYTLDIESPFLGENSQPGQFVNVKVSAGGTDPLLRVPLGIHKIAKDGISLLFKVVGFGTNLLKEKQKGQAIDIVGPLGNGFDISGKVVTKKTRAILIAGGYGVSPLFALAAAITKKKGTVDFLIGARTEEHVVCAEELNDLGAKVYISTEDGTLGKKGLVTDLLKNNISNSFQDKSDIIIFSCGPEEMTKAVAILAKENQIPAQVTMDEYMACGIGACRGCAVQTTLGVKLACSDGPVFDAGILKL